MTHNKFLGLRLPASLYDALEAEAQRTRRKVSAVVREAIRNGLQEKKITSAELSQGASAGDEVHTNQHVL